MSAQDEPASTLARRAREATGLCQARFAGMLGVSTATVSAWEQGRRQPATQRLAHALLRLIAAQPELCVEALGAPPARPRRRWGSSRTVAQVLACCKELAQGSAARVPLDRLRAALEDLERSEVDEALLRLEEAGKLTLHEPLFPSQLADPERESQLEHPRGYRVLFVELP
ncbi:MAG: helix-turn-helix domain-containing protein [Planctomycetota bacterium]